MERHRAYLRDITEAAILALSYVAGIAEAAFRQNTQTQDAVIRRLEMMGEAARSYCACSAMQNRWVMPRIWMRFSVRARNFRALFV